MTDLSILFLGGAKRVSLAERFIAAGRQAGHNVSILAYELKADVPIAGVAKVVLGKLWRDPEFEDHLAQVVRENKVKIVLPFVDDATVAAAKVRSALPGCFVPVSDESVCRMFLNKRTAEEWFRTHEIPVPPTDDTFPVIAKPVNGAASQGLEFFSSATEQAAFFAAHNRDDYIVQRRIDGEEFTVDCYVSMTGRVLAAIPRRRLEVSGGEVVSSRTVVDEEITGLTRKILTEGKLRGPVNVQFIRERSSGKLYVMEVNPRFGGGVILSIEAGANIPLMILNEAMGMDNEPVTGWKENLLMMRAAREYFV